MRVRPWYNPAQRSAVFIVPGIVGVLLTITMTLIMSTAVVREQQAEGGGAWMTQPSGPAHR